MKKVLSVFLAICVMLMSSITAFAAEAPSSEKVTAQIEGAAAYLTNGVESYGVDTAVDFCVIADSGADISKYKRDFVSDVKANLDANNGKIVSSYGENLATYAAVIIILGAFDEDASDFYGYNIEKAFLAMDPTVEPASPNYYRIITQGAAYCMDDSAESFLNKVCDSYISKYYTMGKGVNYYGYSCDNTAYFIDAITWSDSEKYIDILNDAIKVLDTYKVDGGYCYSTTNWDGSPVTELKPNADSTALALAAHCSYSPELDSFNDLDNDAAYMELINKNFEIVNSIYADLCTFEGSSTGVFTYDGEDSAYATKEALIALSYYILDVSFQEMLNEFPLDDEENEETTTAVTKIPSKNETTAKAETTAATKTNTSKKSPNTGSDAAAVSAAIALCAAAGVLTALKKKER